MWPASNKKDDDIENPQDPIDLSGGGYTIMSKSSETGTGEKSTGLPGIRKRFGLEKQKTQRIIVERTLLERMSEDGVVDPKNRSSMSTMESSLGKFFRGTHHQGQDKVQEEDVALYIKEMIGKEFPEKDQIPTGSQLVNVGEMHHNRSLYEPGDWVEIEGLDMKWRLDMITRVIKTAPDDWDWSDPANEGKEPKWTFTYNAGTERNVEAYDLRASETGLKILFGKRPWVWQQYALLKLESKLRFQKGHQDDFMEFDIQKYGADLWEEWLQHPSNAEFRNAYYDERIGERGRVLLANHIQKPFNLIDTMGEENTEWTFKEDDNINVFTYLSLFGSGIVLPILVLSVQIAIPILLVIEANRKEICEDGDKLEPNVILAKITSLAIFAYYLFSIIPDTYANFFNVVGAADSVYSRLLSLRRELWLQADDSILQMFGYRLDIYLNTSYETLLSMLNIYVILNTDEPIEIVLNALAFTFIARMDEDLVKSGWYDPEKRWATSGCMTVCMQTHLKLSALRSRALFSKQFGIPEEMLKQVGNGDNKFLEDKGCAKLDSKDPRLMNNEEKIELMCSNIATDTANKSALDEYRKPNMYFGTIERTFSWCGFTYPVFERFTDFRTWSKWNNILFLAPVPDLDDVFDDTNGDGNSFLSTEIDESSLSLANFYPNEDGVDAWTLFLRHFRDVLLFRDLVR